MSQLCNKRNGTCFTAFDEQLTEAFATFCGLSLVQVRLWHFPSYHVIFAWCHIQVPVLTNWNRDARLSSDGDLLFRFEAQATNLKLVRVQNESLF